MDQSARLQHNDRHIAHNIQLINIHHNLMLLARSKRKKERVAEGGPIFYREGGDAEGSMILIQENHTIVSEGTHPTRVTDNGHVLIEIGNFIPRASFCLIPE